MKKKHRLPLPILFEDDDVIVVEKPAGLLATHTKLVGRLARESQLTAENLLNDYVRKGQAKSKKRVWLVHRLDRKLGETEVAPRVVHRRREVGARVEECSVDVEENCWHGSD